MEQLEGATTVERMILDQAKRTRTPANGSIELLPLCNMNCDMCYVRLSREEMERQGRLRTADEWLEIGRQMKEAGVLFLLLTGGEPFLYPDFRRLYLGLREMGMILTINTNGTLIDEELAEFFGKHKPRRVNITLYGTDEETYADLCHYPGGFEKTLQGIRLLRENLHCGSILAGTHFGLLRDSQMEERLRSGKIYDVVIFDEAGMSSLEELLLCTRLGRRAILFGDHRQLPPFPLRPQVLTTLKNSRPVVTREENAILTGSAMEWLIRFRGFPVLMLKESYRCQNPRLLRFASILFYNANKRQIFSHSLFGIFIIRNTKVPKERFIKIFHTFFSIDDNRLYIISLHHRKQPIINCIVHPPMILHLITTIR